MKNYKIQIDDTHCNICGKELAKDELKNPTEIKAWLGYGSDHHDEEGHHIRWCFDCLAKLLESCKLETRVSEFTEISPDDYDVQSINFLKDKLPGKFCTACGEGLILLDIENKLAIQTKLNGVKHEVRFCSKCFDSTIDACKVNSFIGHWD